MLERELAVWGHAADLRDRVVAQARASADATQCRAVRFEGVPIRSTARMSFATG